MISDPTAAFTEDEFLAALREAAVPTGFDEDGEVSYSDPARKID